MITADNLNTGGAMSEPAVTPFLVPSGWTHGDMIYNPGGDTYRLLHYPDGVIRFEHKCDRGERGVVVCAPALRIGNGHTYTAEGEPTHGWPNGKPTVNPSILCPDCGTHGFVRGGYWHE